MPDSRLTLALESGMVVLPDDGVIAVFRPSAGADLSALPQKRVQVIQGFRPDYDAWAGRGYHCVTKADASYAAALVCVPRAKQQARALIAQAITLTAGGPVLVDGQKTDGIDSLLRDCRKLGQVGAPLSKAHGKLFSVSGDPAAFLPWMPEVTHLQAGFTTIPGVFSADGIDKGSALLAASLPAGLKGRVADLGAGWGYLSAQVLSRCPAIKELHLVEAEQAALDCARLNVADPRARFHWADATTYAPGVTLDAVVMNPPFHTSRAADPALGAAFIIAAAQMLAPSGQLWMVANRHLPYERSIAEHFRDMAEVAGDASFKILRACHPLRPTRPRQ